MAADHDHSHSPAASAGIVADASVRAARTNDAPAIGVVQAAVFVEAYADHVPAEVLAQFRPEDFARGWSQALAHAQPDQRLVVGCAGEQVVGLAAIGPSPDPDAAPDWAELAMLGVHPQARGAGHGSRLLAAAADIATSAGAATLTAWVPAAAEGTRAFLVGAGFDPDAAYRDRVVGPAGQSMREVRLRALLSDPTPVSTRS